MDPESQILFLCEICIVLAIRVRWAFFFPLSPSPFLFFFFFFISAIYLLFLTGLTKCWKRGMFLPPRQVAAHTQAPVSYYRLHSLCYERFLLSGVEMSKRFSAQLQKPVGLFFFFYHPSSECRKKKNLTIQDPQKKVEKKNSLFAQPGVTSVLKSGNHQ